jgi:hypothetical protein
MMLKRIMKTEIAGQPDVELFQTSWGYAVRYGLQSDSHHPLGEALTIFAGCVQHAMTCAGIGGDKENNDE